MSPEVFRQSTGVFEQVSRPFPKRWSLEAGSLPDRSIGLTFDDGFHDFFVQAYPALKDPGIRRRSTSRPIL
jgi:peptidoglycan/xylan/chitin deacetylase (PgdA/CDA1 family)